MVGVYRGWEGAAAFVAVLVDLGGYGGEFGEQGDAIVEGGLPVFGLVDALFVRFGKGGGVIEGGDGAGELGHWVQVGGKAIEHVFDEVWEGRFLGEFSREGADLGRRGDLAGQEQPEHGFGQHFGAGGAFGEDLLAVFDCSAVETDAFVCVEDGSFPNHCFESSALLVRLADGDDSGGECTSCLRECFPP